MTISAPVYLPKSGGPATSSGDPKGTSPTGSGGGTHVFGNTEGRDPDLIFAGEKIMVNGKAYTVKDGETLSSIAAAHGTTVEALIKENKMDGALLGKDAAGAYYATGGSPQPSPGGTVASPPTDPAAPSTTAPKKETPPSDDGTAPSDGPKWLIYGGPMNEDRAEAMLAVLGDKVSDPAERAELERIILKAAGGDGDGRNLTPEELNKLNHFCERNWPKRSG
jgi:hypothetical protein